MCTLTPMRIASEGFGRVVDPTTVEITMADGSTKKLKTKNILVATGGTPTKIPIEGAVSLDHTHIIMQWSWVWICDGACVRLFPKDSLSQEISCQWVLARVSTACSIGSSCVP